jgi:hypothetical protein
MMAAVERKRPPFGGEADSGASSDRAIGTNRIYKSKKAGLAQWQCSGFVIRSQPSRCVPSNTKKWRIVWVFAVRKRSSCRPVPARATAFGSNFGSKVPETFSWPRLGSVGPHLAP